MRKIAIFSLAMILFCCVITAIPVSVEKHVKTKYATNNLTYPVVNYTAKDVIDAYLVHPNPAKIKKIKEEYRSVRERWEKLRRQYILNLYNPVARRQIVEIGKNMSITSAEIMIRRLYYLERKLNNSWINETLKNRMRERLRAYIENLTKWREQLSNTKDEKETVTKIREVARKWRVVRRDVKICGYTLIISRMEMAVKRVEYADEKIRNVTERLRDAGKNVSKVDKKVSDIEKKLLDIKTKIEELKTCLEYENETKMVECLKSNGGKETLKTIRQEYVEIKKELKEVVQMIKAYSKSNAIKG
jgi:CHASE3 domain sensor protein